MDIMRDIKIVLASQSPSRKLLFDRAGIPVEVKVSGVDETVPQSFMPEETVKELARRKAEAVFPDCKDRFVVAADSVAAIDGRIIGKPESLNDARDMIAFLSGKTHRIFTGVCIMHGDMQEVFCNITEVTFYELSDDEIDEYIKTGESMGKAGSYGIEGKGIMLIEKINGDYANVVGLPMAETLRRIRTMLSK